MYNYVVSKLTILESFVNFIHFSNLLSTILICILIGYVDNEQEFRDLMMQYWFYKFSRSDGVLDSSGFEHTFQVFKKKISLHLDFFVKS